MLDAKAMYQIDGQNLMEFARILIEKTKQETEADLAKNGGESLLTKKQFCEKLQIDEVTAWRWQQRGYVVPLRIGGKVRYKQSDVTRLINGR